MVVDYIVAQGLRCLRKKVVMIGKGDQNRREFLGEARIQLPPRVYSAEV